MVSEPSLPLSDFLLSPIRIIIYIIMLCLSFRYYAFLAEASRLVILPPHLDTPIFGRAPISVHPPPSRNLFCLHLYISCLSACAHFSFVLYTLAPDIGPTNGPLRFVLYTNFFLPCATIATPCPTLPTLTLSYSVPICIHPIICSPYLFSPSRTIQVRYSITKKLCCHLHATWPPFVLLNHPKGV